eukprot:1158832-Pelagomonas_calceolata.AAC.1
MQGEFTLPSKFIFSFLLRSSPERAAPSFSFDLFPSTVSTPEASSSGGRDCHAGWYRWTMCTNFLVLSKSIDILGNPEIEWWRVKGVLFCSKQGEIMRWCLRACPMKGSQPSTRHLLVKGHTVTSFSNEEERASGKDKLVPFLLESRMREQGAEVRAPWWSKKGSGTNGSF